MNEKEERDLKVLAVPAGDKCSGFARSPAARGRRRTARRTDRRADGCEPRPRAADATRADSDWQAVGSGSSDPRGPGALSTPGRTASPTYHPPGMRRTQD